MKQNWLTFCIRPPVEWDTSFIETWSFDRFSTSLKRSPFQCLTTFTVKNMWCTQVVIFLILISIIWGVYTHFCFIPSTVTSLQVVTSSLYPGIYASCSFLLVYHTFYCRIEYVLCSFLRGKIHLFWGAGDRRWGSGAGAWAKLKNPLKHCQWYENESSDKRYFPPCVSQMSKNAYSKRRVQISGGVSGCVVQGMDVCGYVCRGAPGGVFALSVYTWTFWMSYTMGKLYKP